MIYIFHGDNSVASRKHLISLIEQTKNKGTQIIRLEAKPLTVPILEEALLSVDLFGNSKLVAIESLHSLPRSKKKNQLIDLASTSQTDLALWEKRALTKTMLKKFPQAKISSFKLSNTLFKWLDSLSKKVINKKNQLSGLHRAVEQNGEGMCFAMLIRQIRLLIQAKENHKIKGPPFMVSKLKNQARQFSLRQLIKIHKQLLDLDINLKSSKNQLSLDAELDFLILNM